MIKVKKVLANYPRGEGVKIRVAISNNGKEDYLDIREWVFSNEKWVPSKGKGIWIPWEVIVKMNQDNIIEMAMDTMDDLATGKGKK